MTVIRSLRQGESPPMDLLLEADPEQAFVEAYLREGFCAVACEENEQAVGVYVIVVREDGGGRAAELVNLAVHSTHRGKGVAKRLIHHAAEQAKRLGARALQVGTGNSSLAALAVYQKCGFRITGVERDYFTKQYAESIVEDGIPCLDRINLELDLESKQEHGQ
ncbi:GNAT family N-acetyltransferase [Gorillibacterium timonense]|uniref:GNAT family N-acetyltransferase n=1 Tax=Gorillibacterium timonense TaxID=1689269 RepID=UPI00071C42A0|nr:GNAT family N-acetyltransferase [Gorillibacterium timonense]